MPDGPHAEHVNEVLLGHVVFFVHISLERGEDVLLVQ
jgi:hypothetical protein